MDNGKRRNFYCSGNAWNFISDVIKNIPEIKFVENSDRRCENGRKKNVCKVCH